MKKNTKIKKYIVFAIIIVCMLIIGIILINVGKNGVNKLKDIAKKNVETQIQEIIDSVKQEKENENINSIETEGPVSATLEDLENKFSELGYNLDVSTGEVIYGDYLIVISDELTILSITERITKVDYSLQRNGENFNVVFIIENQLGIEQIELPDLTIPCNNRTKFAVDRTLKENDVLKFKVKIKGKEQKEEYSYIATQKPTINIEANYEEVAKKVDITFPEVENILKYYSLDKGETWNSYTEEVQVEDHSIKEVYSKVVLDDETTTINKPETGTIVWGTYLYNLGNKNQALTGGYTYRVLQSTQGYYRDNTNNMHLYAHSEYGVGYGEVEAYSNNRIDLTNYKTAHFRMDYNVKYTTGPQSWRCRFYYGFKDAKIIDVYGNVASSGQVITMDISQLKGSYPVYFRVFGAAAGSPVWCTIYSIYLEEL